MQRSIISGLTDQNLNIANSLKNKENRESVSAKIASENGFSASGNSANTFDLLYMITLPKKNTTFAIAARQIQFIWFFKDIFAIP